MHINAVFCCIVNMENGDVTAAGDRTDMGLHRADMGLSTLLVLLCWGGVRGTCDVCGVRYDHIKDYSTPFEQDATFPTCAYYQDAACCTAETVDACGPPLLPVVMGG